MFTLTITGQTAQDIANDTLELAGLFGRATELTTDIAPPNAVVLNGELGKLPETKPRTRKSPAVTETNQPQEGEKTTHPSLTDDAIAAANAKAQAEADAYKARMAAEDEAKAKAEAAAAAAKTEAATGDLVYADVTTALFEAQKRTNRDAVVAILAKHGLTTARDSDPALWPALVADLKAL